ncbi:hypothetical protein MASR2M39_23290 [Ignavibacteriales bacterium]
MIRFKLFLTGFLMLALVGTYIYVQAGEAKKAEEEIKPVVVPKRNLTQNITDSLINSTLEEYSIPDTFYVVPKKGKKLPKVLVPEDLPLPTLDNSLYSKLSRFECVIKVTRNKKEKGSLFSLKFKDNTEYQFLTVTKKGFVRTSTTISMVITGYEEAEEVSKQYLKDYPEPYVVLLKPTKKTQLLAKEFDEQNLPYAVLVGGDGAELEFQIEENHPKRRIETTISGLITAFPNSVFFFTESNSALANSVILPFVRERFEGKKKQFIKSNVFINVEGTDSAETVFKFNELYGKNRKKEGLVFIVNTSAIKWIEPEIKKLRRKGVHISGEIGKLKEEPKAPDPE